MRGGAVRVLLAWEFGDNLGHAVPLARLARRLRAAGHRVHAAVQRLDSAGPLLHPHVDGLHQAPGWPFSPQDAVPPVAWADLLRPFGWARADDLEVLLRAWDSVFAAAAPDVLVSDAAPTALLAARGRVPAVAYGNGWSLPPRARPLPPLRWWDPGEPASLARREAPVAAAAAGAVSRRRDAPLGSLDEVFDGVGRICHGLPATDAFGPLRPPGDAVFVPPPIGVEEGAPARFPAGEGPRVFAYLSARHPALAAVLRALDAAPARVLAYVRGLPPAAARAHRRIAFAPGPVQLDQALAGADAAVCHSIAGSGAAFLAAGVPVLALPTQLEQEAAARTAHAALGGAAPFALPVPATRWGDALAAVLAPAARARAAAAALPPGDPPEDVILRWLEAR